MGRIKSNSDFKFRRKFKRRRRSSFEEIEIGNTSKIPGTRSESSKCSGESPENCSKCSRKRPENCPKCSGESPENPSKIPGRCPESSKISKSKFSDSTIQAWYQLGTRNVRLSKYLNRKIIYSKVDQEWCSSQCTKIRADPKKTRSESRTRFDLI